MLIKNISFFKKTAIILSLFIIASVISCAIYYTLNTTPTTNISDNFTGPPKNYKFKKFANLKSLESELNFGLLNSSYFSGENYEVIYTNTSIHASDVFIVPKEDLKKYTGTINESNISNFLTNIKEPYLSIYISHEKGDAPLSPIDFLGEYKPQNNIPLKNGSEAQFIKSSFSTASKPIYITEFIHNKASYKISNLPSRDAAIKILNSFFTK